MTISTNFSEANKKEAQQTDLHTMITTSVAHNHNYSLNSAGKIHKWIPPKWANFSTILNVTLHRSTTHSSYFNVGSHKC